MTKFLLAHREQRYQSRRIKAFTRLVGRFIGRDGLDVIRTNFLANITAEDVVAHEGAKMKRDDSLEFNRQVGDAATGVENVGPDECSCRASFQTQIALAATVSKGAIEIQLHAQEQLPQKKPRAAARGDEMSVFANPADAGDAGQIPFQDGTRIDEGLPLDGSRMDLPDPAQERLQFLLHEVVIVVTPSVAGNPTSHLARSRRSGKRRIVIHSHRDDRHRPRQPFLRIPAQRLGPLEISELPSQTPAQPLRKRFLMRRSVNRRNSDQGKSEPLSLRFYTRRELTGALNFSRRFHSPESYLY